MTEDSGGKSRGDPKRESVGYPQLWQQIVRHVPAPEPPTHRVGIRLARYLVGLIGFVLVLISLYAWMSAPSPAMVDGLLGRTAGEPSEKALQAYIELRSVWSREVKDYLQTVSLLVPLLAAIIGHIFGRQDQAETGEEDNV